MNRQQMIAFINALRILNQRFINQVPNVNDENAFDIQYTREISSVCYDPFDFLNTSLPYEKIIFSYNQNELCLELDNLNASFGKAVLKTSKDVLENVMLVNELLYDGNNWLYYPPIDIQQNIAMGQEMVSIPEILTDDKIRDVLVAAFSDDE